jgi:tetratricopeptide (TPR) repeat protein
MNANIRIDEKVAALGRASRRAALVSLLGFLLVFGALAYGSWQLRTLANQKAQLQREQESLAKEVMASRADVVRYRSEARSARQAVSASRAAINAFHAGRLEDAVDLYDEALAADPGNAYVQNLRAYALFRLHDVDKALEGQRRSLEADPGYAWGYFDLARFLCASSPPRWDEARAAATKAVELRPDLREIMRRDGEFQRTCQGKLP